MFTLMGLHKAMSTLMWFHMHTKESSYWNFKFNYIFLYVLGISSSQFNLVSFSLFLSLLLLNILNCENRSAKEVET